MLARFAHFPSRLKWCAAGLLSMVWFIIYLTTVSPTVNFIDSGELIAAANEPGIAHAPGYPLYVLMGYVATHLLGGDVAWRLNVFSAFWGAAAVGAFFLLVCEFAGYMLARPARSARRGALVTSARAAKPARGNAPRGNAASRAKAKAGQARVQVQSARPSGSVAVAESSRTSPR